VQNSSLSASSTTSRLSFHRYPLHQLLLLPPAFDHSVSFPTVSHCFNRTRFNPQSLFSTRHPDSGICGSDVYHGRQSAACFNQILVAIYLAGAAYVYQLVKHKPWWVLLASALATVLILLSPSCLCLLMSFATSCLVACQLESSLPELLVRMFFGAGLMEELLKLPVWGVSSWSATASPWRERIGVQNLDGILLGTASAVSFTLVETLGQYVPEMIRNGVLKLGLFLSASWWVCSCCFREF